MKKGKLVHISKDIGIIGDYDVVVCGGGPAGFIAAIAAAREGARTALVHIAEFFFLRCKIGRFAPQQE